MDAREVAPDLVASAKKKPPGERALEGDQEVEAIDRELPSNQGLVRDTSAETMVALGVGTRAAHDGHTLPRGQGVAIAHELERRGLGVPPRQEP